MGFYKKIGIAIGIFLIFLYIISPSPKKEAPPKSPEKIRKEKIEAQFNPWDGSHINLERIIRENMNDPKSYEHIQTTYYDGGDYIFVKTVFRGKNAFGGVVVNSVTARTDLKGTVLDYKFHTGR